MLAFLPFLRLPNSKVTRCPLFENGKVICRVKPDSQHRWASSERVWYIRNYCESDYHPDCEDYQAYYEQQAIASGKILVIDDEPVFLETLRGFFSARGYAVLTAGSAEEALKVLETERPALALVDIKLPGMDGIQLLRVMKRRHPAVRTLVITAYDEENKRAVEAIGADGFFAKPVGLDQLKKKIVEVLGGAGQAPAPGVAAAGPSAIAAAKLLFVLEVLPQEEDRISVYLREWFSDEARSGGRYQTTFAYGINESVEKLMSVRPDIVLINFDSLFQISCSQLAARIVQSPYRPKEVIVYGLNLEAEDKRMIEGLGLQYVDQRKTFARLVTRVREIALRHNLLVPGKVEG